MKNDRHPGTKSGHDTVESRHERLSDEQPEEVHVVLERWQVLLLDVHVFDDEEVAEECRRALAAADEDSTPQMYREDIRSESPYILRDDEGGVSGDE